MHPPRKAAARGSSWALGSDLWGPGARCVFFLKKPVWGFGKKPVWGFRVLGFFALVRILGFEVFGVFEIFDFKVAEFGVLGL